VSEGLAAGIRATIAQPAVPGLGLAPPSVKIVGAKGLRGPFEFVTGTSSRAFEITTTFVINRSSPSGNGIWITSSLHLIRRDAAEMATHFPIVTVSFHIGAAVVVS
jgi:hypothetical protein